MGKDCKNKMSVGQFLLERNINIHWDIVVFKLHFWEIDKCFFPMLFGANGKYQETLKALCLLSRMPAGFSPPNTYPNLFKGISDFVIGSNNVKKLAETLQGI